MLFCSSVKVENSVITNRNSFLKEGDYNIPVFSVDETTFSHRNTIYLHTLIPCTTRSLIPFLEGSIIVLSACRLFSYER